MFQGVRKVAVCPVWRSLQRCARLLFVSTLVLNSTFGGPAADPPPKQQDKAGEKSSRELPPVVVVGKPWRDFFAAPALESPGLDTSITVVNRADMEAQNAYTLTDALKYVPGAWIEHRGRKVKEFFSVRGQRYPYPEYALSGVWQREFHEMPYFISAENVERIEVLRSSSALLTGPGGLVGIVNIVPRMHKKREVIVSSGFGSFNTWTVHVNHGDTLGAFSYALGAGNRSTEGPRGRNAEENMSDFYGRVAFEPTERLSFSLTAFGLYGKRELEQAKEPAAEKFREDLSRYDPYRAVLVVGKGRVRQTDWTMTELQLTYALRDHHFILASESDPAGTTITEKDYEYGANVIQVVHLFDRNTARAGCLYNRWVAPNGKRFYVGRRCDLQTISAVVVDEQRIGPAALNAGYRASRTYIDEYGAFNIEGSPKGLKKVDPVKDKWEPFAHNASVGAAYYVSDALSFHANFSFGQIEPRSGTLTVDMEQPDRETRYKVDVGVREKLAGLGTAAVTGFYVIRDNAIVLSGQTAEVEGRTFELYLNRDQVDRGVEVDLQSERFPCGLSGFCNVVFMETRIKEDGGSRRDREVPEVILSAGLDLKKFGFSASLFAKYVSAYQNDRFVASGLGPQDLGDFVELNLHVGYTFDKKGHYYAYVAAENLTNDKFSTVAGYPDFGTRLYAGLRLTF